MENVSELLYKDIMVCSFLGLLLGIYVLLMRSFMLFFLIAFGVGPRLHDPQLTRPKTGKADLV